MASAIFLSEWQIPTYRESMLDAFVNMLVVCINAFDENEHL